MSWKLAYITASNSVVVIRMMLCSIIIGSDCTFTHNNIFIYVANHFCFIYIKQNALLLIKNPIKNRKFYFLVGKILLIPAAMYEVGNKQLTRGQKVTLSM